MSNNWGTTVFTTLMCGDPVLAVWPLWRRVLRTMWESFVFQSVFLERIPNDFLENLVPGGFFGDSEIFIFFAPMIVEFGGHVTTLAVVVSRLLWTYGHENKTADQKQVKLQ